MTSPARSGSPLRLSFAGWWRRRAGVRIRASLATALVLAVALLLGGVLLVTVLRNNLLARVDADALQQARELGDVVQQQGVLPQLPDALRDSGALVQVLAGDRVLFASPSIDREQPLTTLRPAPGRFALQEDVELRTYDEEAYRLAAVGVRLPDGRQAVVAVARDAESVRDSVQSLSALLVGSGPPLVLAAAASAFWLVGRALRPVEAIRRRVEAIDAGQLGERVPVPPAGDEVGRLALTMNAMLDRLHSAASAQRRFVSDSSHELRSPLAVVRTTVEVARQHPEQAQWEQVADVVLLETARLQSLVEDLLLLARTDEGGLQLRLEEVDLDDLVAAEVKRLRRESKVRVEIALQPVRVLGDDVRLAQVLRNLTDNAVRYAADVVSVRLTTSENRAVLEVGDDGPGVPTEDQERVFERFVRLDESRSRAVGGTGLGLAIVRQIVAAHHGSVKLGKRPQGGAVVRVELPLPLPGSPTGPRRPRGGTAR